ncbi:hypothetical protein [Erwinia tasmaniensis]|uniref:hypothetical protein n=1 Tax=Erwinia tasmaniensis TaxID=338565 RepID=UPI003A4D687E
MKINNKNIVRESGAALVPSYPILGLSLRWTPLSYYQRLFLLVTLVNTFFLIYGVTSGHWWSEKGIQLVDISNMVLVNLAIAVLIRQQYIINFLFRLVWRVPLSWPLFVRRRLAKVYHFGGLHSGCALFACLWLIVFSAAVYYHHCHALPNVSAALVTINALLAALLAIITIMAHPAIRRRYHNLFEHVHRYVGWAALLLSWGQAVCFTRDCNGGLWSLLTLAETPAFWTLLAITGSIILPWLRLRKVPVTIERPSEHAAIVSFDLPRDPFAGSSFAISRSPLSEWHAFANIPFGDRSGCRMLISRAGDWTSRFIDSPPSHVWFKGLPTPGVGSVGKIFHSVIYVATGSGIGPLLPHLMTLNRPRRLIWSTRNPRLTYGDQMVDEIIRLQPDVLIWDTDAHGKPDLLQLALHMADESEAEAVICIANRKLTDYVVEGCEAKGVAAYGAIWDS